MSNFYRAWQGKDGWKEINETIIKYNMSHRIDWQIIVEGSKRDVGKFPYLNRTGRVWNGLDVKMFKGLGDHFSVTQFRKKLY